jgi:7-cyano-7-deazaguanine reductase
MTTTPNHGILGQTTDYPKTYAPDIIYPISRELGRRHLALSADKLSVGVDWWHAFEVSWLNPQGISQVAMLRLTIPASSPFIVESKSLKLYLNSLNFTEFTDSQSVIDTIEQDLSSALQTQVGAELINIDDAQSLPLYQPEGLLIDTVLNDSAQKVALTEDVDSRLLAFDTANTLQNSQRQVYHSHLLRSNCPVTNQPDWGTLLIDITSAPIDKGSLLQYILTFRQHNGFHEQCVEQIFSDLTLKFAPEKLLVRAWYTRRGGIDINPCRVSDLALLPSPSRVNRQ